MPPRHFNNAWRQSSLNFLATTWKFSWTTSASLKMTSTVCLSHLTTIMEVCIRKQLVLSREKSHFMVREGVVLGHIGSGKGLEVDKAKIEVIQNLPLPSTMQDFRSFLGHVSFYQRFIQHFAKVSKPLTTLLCKDKDFIIDKEGKCAFVMLKQPLMEEPILQSPN